MNDLDTFYFEKEEPVKSCLIALKDIIQNFHLEFEHKWYYRLPCFLYKKQIFCYLWVEKKTQTPYIAIGKGVQINHPDLIKGDRTFTSLFMVNPNEDISIDKIYDIFNEVIKRYK